MRRWLLGIAIACAGCAGKDVCAGFAQSCLSLEVRSAAGESLSIDQLELSGLQGFPFPDGNQAFSPATPRPAVVLPVRLAVLPPPDFAGAYQLEIRGLVAGTVLREGFAVGSVAQNQHLSVVAILDQHDDGSPVGSTDLAGVDLTRPQSIFDLAGQAATPDLAGACDPASEGGCSSFLQKCSLSGASTMGAPTCVPAGTLAEGSSCSNDDQCNPTTICFVGDNNFGLDRECRLFCDHDNGDADCPALGDSTDAGPAQQGHCLQLTNDSSLGVCSTPCNPVTAAGPSLCPASTRCYYNPFVNADILDFTDCTSIIGTKTDGMPCSTEQDCAPGFYCRTFVPDGESLVCRQLCRKGVDADCSESGYSCVADLFSFGGCCPAGGC